MPRRDSHNFRHHSQPYFDKLRTQVAPNQPDVTTWFKLLDLDEKRAG